MAISSFSRSGLARVVDERVKNADFSNTATGTYSSGGSNYKYVTFTGNGTLTITTAGKADILVVAGGGGASGGASGAYGGGSIAGSVYFPTGSYTVTIGGGGYGSSGAGAPGTGSHSQCGSEFRAEGASGMTWFNGPGGFWNVTASRTSALNNSSTTYANRGANSGSASGAANTGNGGGSSTNSTGGSGGSGIVIVRVEV